MQQNSGSRVSRWGAWRSASEVAVRSYAFATTPAPRNSSSMSNDWAFAEVPTNPTRWSRCPPDLRQSKRITHLRLFALPCLVLHLHLQRRTNGCPSTHQVSLLRPWSRAVLRSPRCTITGAAHPAKKCNWCSSLAGFPRCVRACVRANREPSTHCMVFFAALL